MINLKIRVATTKDVSIIARLHYKSGIYQSKYSFTMESLEFNKKKDEEEIRKQIVKKNHRILVAEVDNEIVGFIIAEINKFGKSKRGFIEDIFVKKNYRRKGTGRKLIKEILKWLKENKVEYVNSWVFIKNKKAIRFYDKLGFEKHGFWEIKNL